MIFLSPISPTERTDFLQNEVDAFFYVPEDPPQTYRGLEKGKEYYAYIQENDAEFKKYQRKAKKVFGAAVARLKAEETGPRAEGCSCVEGNPCVDQYVCKNWEYRFAIAKKNGWKEAF